MTYLSGSGSEPGMPLAHDVQSSGGLEARALLEQLRASMFGREPLTSIDRFRIHGVLGRGAFGSVLDAYDPGLERRIAIKILHRVADDPDEPGANSRMLREARALARLSHPNVVPVFAAGEHGGRVWFAMERVVGSTLGEWHAAHPPGSRRRARQALGLLLQAGRGLAAAHAAGLLHRDVKPANVLVGEDGRVRVADFGLVREATAGEGARTDRTAITERDVDYGITRTGTAVGTPRYMAPEQFQGREVDAHSDQFGFAVSAWEVLYGTPPFPGATASEIEQAIARGSIDPPAQVEVPAAVERVLRRALACAPSDRFRAMDDLLRELGAAMHGRSRWAMVALACVTTLAAVGLVLRPTEHTRPPCDEAAARAEIASLWAPPRRDAIAAVLRDRTPGYAEATLASIDRELAAFTDAYATQHVSACRALWHEGTADERDFDERMTCLRERRTIADAVLDRLEHATAGAAERAVSTVESLPSPRGCEALGASAEAPTPLASSLRARLATAQADLLADDTEAAAANAKAVALEARREDLAEILGDALELQTRARDAALLRDDAAEMVEAYEIAVATGDDDRAFHRALMLASHAAGRTQVDSAHRWLRHAESALVRTQEPGTANRAALALTECFVLHAQGRDGEARPRCEDAAALVDDPSAGDVRQGLRDRIREQLAVVYFNRGELDLAESILRALRAEAIVRLGATHPHVGTHATELSWIALARGDATTAVALAREGVETRVAARGPTDLFLITAHESLGEALAATGDFEEAERAYERALAVAQANPSGDDANDTIVRAGRRLPLAILWSRQPSRLSDAIELLQAIDRELRPLLPEHDAQVVETDQYLGRALIAAERYADAEAPLARAAAALKAQGDPDLPEVLVDRAVVAEAQGDMDGAREHYEAAIVAAGTPPSSPATVAASRLAAMSFAVGERGRARAWLELATLAAAGLDLEPTASGALELARALDLTLRGERDRAHAAVHAALERLATSHDLDAREQERRLARWSSR
jgi:tetratricopeptide (TPR) repeat protein